MHKSGERCSNLMFFLILFVSTGSFLL